MICVSESFYYMWGNEFLFYNGKWLLRQQFENCKLGNNIVKLGNHHILAAYFNGNDQVVSLAVKGSCIWAGINIKVWTWSCLHNVMLTAHDHCNLLHHIQIKHSSKSAKGRKQVLLVIKCQLSSFLRLFDLLSNIERWHMDWVWVLTHYWEPIYSIPKLSWECPFRDMELHTIKWKITS